ncbi:hypothetical protein [Flavobacterium suzhouense]|uniref:Uncharacterized protein n=1 Tax=Flavobacterium suzhouense TaxID=1529638 RepID=A0ABW5NRQ1_9FLAO
MYNGGYNFWSIHSCYTLSDIRENWEEIGREIISSLKSVELNDKVNAKDVFKVIDAQEFVKYLRSRKPELLDHSAYLITVLYIKGYTTKQFKEIFKTFTKCNIEEVKLRDEMLMDLEKHAKTVFS